MRIYPDLSFVYYYLTKGSSEVREAQAINIDSNTHNSHIILSSKSENSHLLVC